MGESDKTHNKALHSGELKPPLSLVVINKIKEQIMASREQVAIPAEGTEAWNSWRGKTTMLCLTYLILKSATVC